jgi:hypothetical protein
MRSRVEIIIALQEIDFNFLDPGLTVLENNNLNAGAVMLLWVLGESTELEDKVLAGERITDEEIKEAIRRVTQ